MTSAGHRSLDLPANFSHYTLPSPGIPNVRDEMVVVTTGIKGPGVILMHEASGMSEHCLGLATELADSGFRMFLPLLFGKPGQSKAFDIRGLFCMRKEMHFLASRRTSPITQLLRRLIVDVANKTEREKVGVIGMCLTGNLVFALMGAAGVGAAISSQPSLPLPLLGRLTSGYKKAALATNSADLMEAVRSETPLLALRFAGDRICPTERFDSLKRLFGETGALDCQAVPGDRHALLTAHRPIGTEDDKVPTVKEFLMDHLSN
jgi:dienelactone hydrolase